MVLASPQLGQGHEDKAFVFKLASRARHDRPDSFPYLALIPATSSGMIVTAHDRAFPVAVSIRWVTVIGPSVRSRVLTNDRG